MLGKWRAFCRDERGATAIEYGIMAIGIALAVVAAVQLTGSNLNANIFTALPTLLL